MAPSWQVTFWGVRGSIPQCGPQYVEVGGNSSCVSVQTPHGLYIFDAGTGIANCGKWISAQPSPPEHIYLFLTHAHLDHIMGLPFFNPLWQQQTTLHIFAGSLKPYGGVQNVLSLAFSPPYFPVPLLQVPATLHFTDFENPESYHISPDAILHTTDLDHPGGATGYRLDGDGLSVAYLTDLRHSNDRSPLKSFAQDADLLIYDATFTDEEFKEKPHWGHSTWREAVILADHANVKQLALFHHDPSHDDAFMREIEVSAQTRFPNAFVARDRMTLTLKGSRSALAKNGFGT